MVIKYYYRMIFNLSKYNGTGSVTQVLRQGGQWRRLLVSVLHGGEVRGQLAIQPFSPLQLVSALLG